MTGPLAAITVVTIHFKPSQCSAGSCLPYDYDGLHRLQDMGRGTLNVLKTALTTETFAQCWTLDETGNWAGFRQDGTGSGWDLIQSRTANEVNEITVIDNTVGASWATPAYDAAGNMTTIPTANPPGWSDMSTADWSGLSLDNWESLPVDGSPDTYTATYDAWNRLVKLLDTSSTDIVAEYEYDARRYRTVVKSYVSGSLDETRHVYYTDGWQAIEERLDTATDPDRQYLWGLRYIDDLILRDRDTNANGTLDERLYALQDGNWNVIALTDQNGDVQERYAYTAYGLPLFLSSSFATLSSSNFGWETLYCGYRWDTGTEVYAVRNRYLQPALGVWTTRDPLDNRTYEYNKAASLSTLDPFGTSSFFFLRFSTTARPWLDPNLTIKPTVAPQPLWPSWFGSTTTPPLPVSLPTPEDFPQPSMKEPKLKDNDKCKKRDKCHQRHPDWPKCSPLKSTAFDIARRYLLSHCSRSPKLKISHCIPIHFIPKECPKKIGGQQWHCFMNYNGIPIDSRYRLSVRCCNCCEEKRRKKVSMGFDSFQCTDPHFSQPKGNKMHPNPFGGTPPECIP